MHVITLMKKDIRLIYKRLVPAVIAFLGFMIWFSQLFESAGVVILTVDSFAVLLSMISIIRDDTFKLDQYWCSMGVTRRDVVISRYILSWSMTLVSTIIILTICVSISSFMTFAGLLMPKYLLMTISFWGIFISTLLPCVIIFGAKGLFVLMNGFTVLGVIVYLFANFFGSSLINPIVRAIKPIFLTILNTSAMPTNLAIFAISAIILSYLSYRLSLYLFRKKEF